MPISVATFARLQTHAGGMVSGWRSVPCCLCVMVMFLPMGTFPPVDLSQQFLVECERDVQEGEQADVEAKKESRKLVSLPPARKLPADRHVSSRLLLCHRTTGDRSEFRFLNGTGAPLLC